MIKNQSNPIANWDEVERKYRADAARKPLTVTADQLTILQERIDADPILQAALAVNLAYGRADQYYAEGGITATPTAEKVNIFDHPERMGVTPYRAEAKFQIHEALGEVVIQAAREVHGMTFTGRDGKAYKNCKLVCFDGLRTMEGGYLMAAFRPEAVSSGLLALPGTSAHNRGMAVDAMVFYKDDRGQWVEAPMGGHFDHLDMESNHRNYTGPKVDNAAQHNRLQMERAFVAGALKTGRLIAPLREEFWDFRFPESSIDLWRVLESVARCIGDNETLEKRIRPNIEHIRALSKDGHRDEAARLYAFTSHEQFKRAWFELFAGKQEQLTAALGTAAPPADDSRIVYHGQYNVIFDSDLPEDRRLGNAEELKRLLQEQAPQAKAVNTR